MSLWQKVFLGLIAGIIVGASFGQQAAIFQPLGTIFINLILMVVIPVIFTVLVNGIASMQSASDLKRLGIKSIVAFLGTACIAVIIGIVATTLLQPGVGAALQLQYNSELANAAVSSQSLREVLLGMVPSNALKSMVEGNILHVILFALFTGFTLNSMRDRCQKIILLFKESSQLMLKMIETIVQFAPFGVFGYMSWVVGTQGVEVLVSLSKLIGTIVLGCAIQYGIFGLIILLAMRVSPLPFYRKMLEPQLIAFSTSSSKAALTSLMHTARKKLGISETNTNFLIPLSAALNMDGGAIYLGSCVIFFAQAVGLTLAPQDYLVIIVTCTLGSVGAAGIPSGILLFLGMALSSIGLPIEAVAIIAGIDRILDMLTTAINVTGDACITMVIDHSEGTLDRDTYLSHEDDPSVADARLAVRD